MKNFKLTGSFVDLQGMVWSRDISIPYLNKFVDPEKEYNLPNSNRPSESSKGFQTLKGKDLTQNQIAYLFFNQIL